MSEFDVWSGVTYLAAALGIILGLILSIQNLMVGIPLLLAGIIAIPRVQKRIKDDFEIELTEWIVVGIYCSLFALSVAIAVWFTNPV